MENENKTCCTAERHKHRTPEEERRLISRLNRIEGQIRGIRAMVSATAWIF